MEREQTNCLFCRIPKERIISENEYVFAVRDGFPVTELHTLIIPKRHISDYWGLIREELIASDHMLRSLRKEILEVDSTVEGFNIGTNSGQTAGQTIFHCHFHLIPRRRGDVEDPRGGIRHVIPEKGKY